MKLTLDEILILISEGRRANGDYKIVLFLLVLLGRVEFHAHVMRLYEWIDRLHRNRYYYTIIQLFNFALNFSSFEKVFFFFFLHYKYRIISLTNFNAQFFIQ
jgi:hypothetical protein